MDITLWTVQDCPLATITTEFMLDTFLMVKENLPVVDLDAIHPQTKKVC